MNFAAKFEGVKTPSGVRERVSAEEWTARCALAAMYQVVAHYKLTDTIYTHISMRVPGDEEVFLINPFGLLYEEITASTLVKIDIAGNVLDDPTGIGINRAGFIIHGAIHHARPEISTVLHTHSRAGIGVAAQENGLLPISQHAAIMLGRLAYHEFEGIAVHEEEQKSLVADLGSRTAMILRNHGLLTVGRTPGEALYLMLTLERACEAQIAAQAGGGPLRHVSQAALDDTTTTFNGAAGDFARDWAAFLRLAARIAPHFVD